MPITLPNSTQSAGVPGQWSETIGATHPSLITGHEPAILTQDHVVAFSQSFPALQVVGFNAAGELVKATWDATPANAVKPIGVAIIGAVTGASGAKKGIPVYRGGCFNPDQLVWDASFDSDAKKFAAFEGSPTPTNIIVRRPRAHVI